MSGILYGKWGEWVMWHLIEFQCHMVDMQLITFFANMKTHRMFKNQLTIQKKKQSDRKCRDFRE